MRVNSQDVLQRCQCITKQKIRYVVQQVEGYLHTFSLSQSLDVRHSQDSHCSSLVHFLSDESLHLFPAIPTLCSHLLESCRTASTEHLILRLPVPPSPTALATCPNSHPRGLGVCRGKRRPYANRASGISKGLEPKQRRAQQRQNKLW